MPFRCIHCSAICKQERNPACADKARCDFQEVELIHWAHRKGQGKVVGMARMPEHYFPQRPVEGVQAQSSPVGHVSVACKTKYPNPLYDTNLYPVTCPECLAVAKKLEAESKAYMEEIETDESEEGIEVQSEDKLILPELKPGDDPNEMVEVDLGIVVENDPAPEDRFEIEINPDQSR